MTDKTAIVLENIHSRKSVRNFTGATVSKSDLDKILKAGMAAPTAVNMQPWSFVAITERKILDDLDAGLPYAKMLTKAGAAIIVCTEPDKAYEKSQDMAIIDAALAGENILLAISALGYASVWLDGILRAENRADRIGEILDIPHDKKIQILLPVGIPENPDAPRKAKSPFEKRAWFNGFQHGL